jgi:hypothetical protein
MSERTHASEPFQDNESDSTPPLRRPSALPIPRLSEIKLPSLAEQPKPVTERRPLVMFDRAFEAQVSVPGSHVPEAAQEEAVKAAAESKEETDDSDEDDEETSPAEAAAESAETADQPVKATTGEYVSNTFSGHLSETAPEPEPSADQQYVSPVIPSVPHPSGAVVHTAESFEQIPGENIAESPADTMTEDPFEKMMVEAGIDPHAAEAMPPSEDDPNDPLYATLSPRLSTPQTVSSTFNFSTTPGVKAPNAPPTPPYTPPNSNSGGGSIPPRPPRQSSNAFGGGSSGPNPNTAYQYAYNAAPSANPNVVTQPGYTDDDLHRARRSGARQGVVAGALAGGLAGRYFANRKARKEQQKMKAEHTAELEQRDATLAQHAQDINKLKGVPEQRDAITGRHMPNPAERPLAAPTTVASSERFAVGSAPVPRQRASEAGPAAIRRPEAPAAVVQSEAIAPEQAPDQQSNPFEHQSDEPHHTVSSEWLKIGVDEHGRAVQQEYGRAFQEETRQEQTGNRSFTTDPRSGQQSGAHENQPHSASYYIGAPLIGTDHQLGSGQVATGQRLQPGTPTHQDPQHLLPSPKKQVASNIINPWFWLMIVIVIVVFFAAASI